MPTHHKHNKGEVYFITFTCYNWLPLIKEANSYKSFDNFFLYLKKTKISLMGYVIMPNHFHCIVYIPETCSKSLNQIVGNGKRFLAYEIINNLKEKGKNDLLKELEDGVQEKEREKGKLHQVFKLSFDAKSCISQKEILIKLDYIHRNPLSGKWNLASDMISYPYSSAAFYELNQNNFFLTHYLDIE